MRAMILCAGRGERLKPLTDTTPKPLIPFMDRPLIDYHLENLSNSGFHQVVINLGHLGQQIADHVGDGSRWGLAVQYSDEQPNTLETGGGLLKALPLLGDHPFLAVNGDIWTDYSFSRLRALKCNWAHLLLVENPPHHPEGDFALEGGRIQNQGATRLTFSGIAVYHPRLLGDCEPGRFSITPLLRETIEQQLVTGEIHKGQWHDIGTVERLEQAQASIAGTHTEAD